MANHPVRARPFSGQSIDCQSCGVCWPKTGSRQRYCASCGRTAILAGKRAADRRAQEKAGAAILGSFVTCRACSEPFQKTAPFQVYCSPACKLASRRKADPWLSVCITCGAAYTKNAPAQRFCIPCGEVRALEKRRLATVENADGIAASKARYRQRNRATLAASAKVYKRTEGYRARARRRRAERHAIDMKFAIRARMSTAIGAALRNDKAGKSWERLVGFTLQELMIHLERQFQRGMTWVNRSEWHIDHILPVASFSYTTAEDSEFRACWALTNLRPLWKSENLSKGARRTTLL